MKTPLSLALSASFACALFFTNCTKDNMNPGERVNAENSSNATTGGDRITAIVKDLSVDSYSLNFNKAYPESGINKKHYGSDTYLAFADPQDVICGDRIRVRYPKVPIWRRPAVAPWPPTCPDMTPDIYKLEQIQELLISANPKLYGTLKPVKFINQDGGFLAADAFFKRFAAMQYDKIDDATANIRLDKFLMLNDQANLGPGATRNFYGYADLNEIVFKPYKKTLKDILPTQLKGCFDPETLKLLRDQLQRIDPTYYKSLTLTSLPENKQIGILTLN